MKIMIINGPNLNLLGTREPEIYGDRTLSDLESYILKHAQKLGLDLSFFQSNSESAIIDMLHKAHFEHYDGVVINAAGFSHTSVAILDAISAISVPCVEVHISNIYAREEFRAKSIISRACLGVISGFGFQGYTMAIDALVNNAK